MRSQVSSAAPTPSLSATCTSLRCVTMMLVLALDGKAHENP